MTRRSLTTCLTFITAALLVACEAVVSPEPPGVLMAKGGEKGPPDRDPPGNTEATVTVTGGVVTSDPAAQTVDLDENDNRVDFNNTAANLEVRMLATHGVGLAACEVVGNRKDPTADQQQALIDKLDDALHVRRIFVTIDKTALGSPSTDHQVGVTWTDEDEGPFDIQIGVEPRSHPATPPTATVVGGDIASDFTVEFSGGTLRLRNRTGKPRDHFSLDCPNLDLVTMDVVR